MLEDQAQNEKVLSPGPELRVAPPSAAEGPCEQVSVARVRGRQHQAGSRGAADAGRALVPCESLHTSSLSQSAGGTRGRQQIRLNREGFAI